MAFQACGYIWMMRSRIVLSVFLGVVFNHWALAQTDGFLQLDSAEAIEWSPELELSWDDYVYRDWSGRNYRGSMAITAVKISARGYLRRGVPEFQVKAIFIRQDSWTSDSTDLSLLHHEQLHFDICEMYAAKIRRKINDLHKDGEKRPQTYRWHIQNLIARFNEYSQEYDKATKFGTDVAEQEKWRMKVQGELKRLH